MVGKLVIIFVSILLAVNCETNQNELIRINNRLALDLLNTFPSEGNNFFSPISITTALLMILNGANGLTEQELRQLFRIDKKTNIKQINEDMKTVLKSVVRQRDDKLILKLANLMLVSNGVTLKTDYQQVMNDMFDTTVESVDFHNNSEQIVKHINDWVKEKTNNKINDILKDKLSADTAMVLLNAIYLKGIWKYLFDKKDTQKGDFYNYGQQEPIQVDMMSMKRRFKIKNVRELDAKIFEMPFVTGSDGTDMSMIILLPNKDNGLDEMTRKLSLKTLNDTIDAISKRRGVTNSLVFPKFKLETEYNLKESLPKLGLKSMFADSADLSAISGQKNLKVSKAIHKAYIDVAEEGAEVAAVTKFVLLLRSYGENPVLVDKPFMFAIVDKNSGLIWFLGQIRSLS